MRGAVAAGNALGLMILPLAIGLLVLAFISLVMFLGVIKQLRRGMGAFGDVEVFD